jgi:hypothetical protein
MLIYQKRKRATLEQFNSFFFLFAPLLGLEPIPYVRDMINPANGELYPTELGILKKKASNLAI